MRACVCVLIKQSGMVGAETRIDINGGNYCFWFQSMAELMLCYGYQEIGLVLQKRGQCLSSI